MKLIPYKEILKYSEEKIQDVMAAPRARATKKQAELEIAKMEEKIVALEQEIMEIAAKHPVDFYALIDKRDDLSLIERKKNQFIKIISELFPEGE